MPANYGFNAADLIRFLPETILTVMGTLLMVLDPILHRRSSHAFGHLSMATLVAAIGGAVYANSQAGPAFGGMLMVDGFATFFRVLVLVVGFSRFCRPIAFWRGRTPKPESITRC